MANLWEELCNGKKSLLRNFEILATDSIFQAKSQITSSNYIDVTSNSQHVVIQVCRSLTMLNARNVAHIGISTLDFEFLVFHDVPGVPRASRKPLLPGERESPATGEYRRQSSVEKGCLAPGVLQCQFFPHVISRSPSAERQRT